MDNIVGSSSRVSGQGIHADGRARRRGIDKKAGLNQCTIEGTWIFLSKKRKLAKSEHVDQGDEEEA
jgi:hypothetical protein